MKIADRDLQQQIQETIDKVSNDIRKITGEQEKYSGIRNLSSLKMIIQDAKKKKKELNLSKKDILEEMARKEEELQK